MRSRAHLCLVEPLETRIAPATLDLVGGVLIFTAGAGVTNTINLNTPNPSLYQIISNEAIVFGAGMSGSGYSGDGGNIVFGSSDIVDGLNFQLGDQDDLLFINGLNGALTVNGEAGLDTVIFTTAPSNPGDDVLVKSETITVNTPIVGAATVELTVDFLTLGASLGATERVTIAPLTPGRAISLGAEVGTALSLTDAELDFISTPDVLAIGDEFSGAITIGGAVSITNAPTLSLRTAAGISQTAALTVANLRAATGSDTDAIALTHASNDVDTFAGSAKGDLSFTDANVLLLGTVDGLAGISVTGAGSTIVLKAGATTQTAAGNITGAKLALTGAGPFTLTNAGNNVTTIAGGSVSGALRYTDADALSVGVVDEASGITANGIALSTVDGDLTITDTAVMNDVQAFSAGTITLSVGGGKTLTVETNASIRSTPDPTLIADHMTIDGTVSSGNAFLGGVFLLPATPGREIVLGAEDPAKLSLTNAELSRISIPVVGSTSGGAITVAGVIDLPGIFSQLLLRSGVGITSSATISVTTLGVRSAGDVVLTGANAVGTFCAELTGPSASLTFEDTVPLALGYLAGQAFGITTGGGPVTLVTDALDIPQSFYKIDVGTGRVAISPRTAGRAINLGTDTGALDLTDMELGFIKAGSLALTTTGTINVSSALTPANLGGLVLNGGDISGAGSIIVGQLGLNATTSATLAGANDVNFLAARTPALSFNDTDGFTIAAPDFLPGFTGLTGTAPGILSIGPGASPVDFHPSARFSIAIDGTTAGTGYTQLRTSGPLDLGGATLAGTPSIAPPIGSSFKIIDNQSGSPVTGTFAGLAEGALVDLGGQVFRVSYVGGDGNDVVLSDVHIPVTLSADKKSATFTDVDGDLVTVKTSKGAFDGSEFVGVDAGNDGTAQLLKLTLGPAFTGANISLTAKRGAAGGNGFVNLGYLDARGVDLGVVSVAGDLGRIDAGTVGGDAKVPAIKSLTVQSLGLLGTSTQALGGSDASIIEGPLPKLTVKGDLRADLTLNGATDGKLGALTIGGSLAEGSLGNVRIQAAAGIGSITTGGDIRGSVSIFTDGAIGTINVGGSIARNGGTTAVTIAAFGQLTAPTKGLDLAIKSLNVRGSVEFTNIFAGVAKPNADASIGAIAVGGDWIASNTAAGAASTDGQPGNADDALVTGGRNNGDLFATIGSFTVKGQALGTADDTNDMFGVVAERIGKAKVGGRTFAFVADKGTTLNREAFFAAPTLDGAGAENPMFDFTVRELGSTTPTVALGGANLDISSDGKTATFTDVDGDLVTVKRTLGEFVMGDFQIVTTASGGGLLQGITITPSLDGKPVNLTIAAKVGPSGGNGFVNVGEIDAGQTDLGTVLIGGELQDLDTGDNDAAKPGLGSLTVHSLGAVAGTSPSGDEINSARGIGAITVKTDVRNFHIFANSSNSGNLGSLTVGGSMITSEVQAAANIGTIKIGGSFRGNERIQATERIGAITVGGDFAGDANGGATIEAFAQDAGPAKGPDFALKSFTAKGSVEKTTIILGRNNNADASVGAISVSHEWIASSVIAGVEAGTDSFIGTADDQKVSLGGPTDLARFSTIASILIKGQALGTSASGDSFGIVAEQIGKAQIGAVKFKLDSGERDAADAFALAPTGPGATGLSSDFFLREVIVPA